MSLKHNVIANFFGQGWTALMGLAFIPMYIRYLGMEAYGIIGLYAILNAWLQLANMGMTPTLNREMARFSAGSHTVESIQDLLRSLETIAFSIAIILGTMVWLASSWLATEWLRAESLPHDQVASAIAVMGFVIVTKFIEGFYQGAILGLQKQVWYNAVQAILATLRWAGSVAVLAWISPTITAYFYWQGTASLISLVVFRAGIYHWLPKPSRKAKFSMPAVRQIGEFAGGMLATTLAALFLTQVDKMLLSKLLTLKQFGQYTLASVVSGALYQVVFPITQAIYPRFTELYSRGESFLLASTYHRGAQLVSIIVGTAACLMIFYSENILRIWTGNKSLAIEVAPILSLLATGTFLNILMQIPYVLQLAAGWSSFSAKANCVAILVYIPALLWTIPRFGALGSAFLWMMLNLGFVSISIHFMHRKLLPTEKYRWYVEDVIRPSIVIVFFMFSSKYVMPQFMTKLSELIWISSTTFFSLMLALFASTNLTSTFFYKFRVFFRNKFF